MFEGDNRYNEKRKWGRGGNVMEGGQGFFFRSILLFLYSFFFSSCFAVALAFVLDNCQRLLPDSAPHFGIMKRCQESCCQESGVRSRSRALFITLS